MINAFFKNLPGELPKFNTIREYYGGLPTQALTNQHVAMAMG